MKNYEKYKGEIIKMLVSSVETCPEIWQLRTGSEDRKCPFMRISDKFCGECESLNEQWLNEEVKKYDPYELKTGDKIKMRRLRDCSAKVYEVVCNSFPALWLRLRTSEKDVSFLASEYGASWAKDENFLIFYDDISKDYEIEEVFR